MGSESRNFAPAGLFQHNRPEAACPLWDARRQKPPFVTGDVAYLIITMPIGGCALLSRVRSDIADLSAEHADRSKGSGRRWFALIAMRKIIVMPG